ncbi:LamB/YcsF family protein [Halotalea alkalilenta]|uniref:5-oxoprolinase subunit A n=1 Tax=Halotalea alkalilenta TaxID=376489 RepID=A0A172YCZ1_9GAMM|nr:5-oxoprolinase subunit PxpA [Halotalea alkalilenta]ANF57121.1 hypothetical protein A5892_06290 [Halotalea alkalilenta]
MQIDINADMGESFGAWKMGDDRAMLALVSSANVACGFHAGDPLVMDRTVRAALAQGVDVGAHPGFLDLWGFGRRRIEGQSGAEIERMVIYQLGAMRAIAEAAGHRMTHVKTHGALGNMAFVDVELAEAVVAAILKVDPTLMLLTAPLTAIERAARGGGLKIAAEVFADRGYDERGLLLPRGQPGAMIEDPHQAAERMLAMLEEGAIITAQGSRLPCPIDSICVHGDGPSAVPMASVLRERLEAAGHQILPLSRIERLQSA